jgi:hypothetical protein
MVHRLRAKELQYPREVTGPPLNMSQVPQVPAPGLKNAQTPQCFAGSVETSTKPIERRRLRIDNGRAEGL